MALLNRYVQQPGDRLKRLIDYDKWLETDEEIDDVDVAVTPESDTPFVVDDILVDDEAKQLAYFTTGGETGTTYTATFTVTTNIGQVREDEVEFEVEET
jgi:hypothetical protein